MENHVPAGVEQPAYVKAGFLAAIAKGETASPLIDNVKAVEQLRTMLGGYNIQPLIAVQVVVTGAQAVSGTERRLAKFLWPVGSEKNPAYKTLNTFLQNEQTNPQTKKP